MTPLISAKIAEYTAALQRVVSAPTGDLGLGSDLSCDDDLTWDYAELPGDDIRLIHQAIYRRLTTPRGTLPDDPDYGFDLRAQLSRGRTTVGLRELHGSIYGELRKDERIDSLSIEVASPRPSQITIDITGTTALGPFALTLALTDAGVLMTAFAGNK